MGAGRHRLVDAAAAAVSTGVLLVLLVPALADVYLYFILGLIPGRDYGDFTRSQFGEGGLSGWLVIAETISGAIWFCCYAFGVSYAPRFIDRGEVGASSGGVSGMSGIVEKRAC